MTAPRHAPKLSITALRGLVALADNTPLERDEAVQAAVAWIRRVAEHRERRAMRECGVVVTKPTRGAAGQSYVAT